MSTQTMSNDCYGSPLYAALRETSGEEWTRYVEHEFVRRLGDATLPGEAFLHYLRQDYVFLFHFSRAWALAVVKSESVEEMTTAAATVDALVNQEMQLHVGVCGAAGISHDELRASKEDTENLAYTRFVMDAGLSGDLLDLLCALAPCVMGYGVIGKALENAANTDPSHPYGDWIRTYAGHEYQSVCDGVGALIERAAASRIGTDPRQSPRWSSLCTRFETACVLEQDFWQMGLRAAAP